MSSDTETTDIQIVRYRRVGQFLFFVFKEENTANNGLIVKRLDAWKKSKK